MTNPSTLPRQNFDQLRRLERERPGLMKEVIRLFVVDAPKQMRLIGSAYAKRDPEGVRQSAHFLRSGALVLGLGWLAEQSKVFEHLEFEQYGSEEADSILSELRAELHAVLLALLGELKDS